MLPAQYGEEGEGYGADRYGTGGGSAVLYSMGYGAGDWYAVEVVIYGGRGYGADGRYGDAQLPGTAWAGYGSRYDAGAADGAGETYDGVWDGVDPFDYLDAAPDHWEYLPDESRVALLAAYRVRPWYGVVVRWIGATRRAGVREVLRWKSVPSATSALRWSACFYLSRYEVSVMSGCVRTLSGGHQMESLVRSQVRVSSPPDQDAAGKMGGA